MLQRSQLLIEDWQLGHLRNHQLRLSISETARLYISIAAIQQHYLIGYKRKNIISQTEFYKMIKDIYRANHGDKLILISKLYHEARKVMEDN